MAKVKEKTNKKKLSDMSPSELVDRIKEQATALNTKHIAIVNELQALANPEIFKSLVMNDYVQLLEALKDIQRTSYDLRVHVEHCETTFKAPERVLDTKKDNDEA